MQDQPAQQPVEQLEQLQGLIPTSWLVIAAVALVAIVVLFVLVKLLSGRKRQAPLQVPDLAIDVLALGNQGPPEGAVVLEHYNVPVRLAAVVLAPAGRVRELPPLNQLHDYFEAVLPGLSQVIATHRPLVRRWPAQLSTKGFAHTFFGHARLPGQGGKGTPWCSAAGIAKIEGQPFMAGLVMRTATTSSRGQEIIEGEEHWMRILRVKGV